MKSQTQFANADAELILPDRGAGYLPGQVLFANDSRFLETYFSEPLTNYAVGWRDPNDIEATLQFIAPAVPVGRRFEWKKAANAEEFLSEVVDDHRAIGSDFKRVEYTGVDVTDRTLNKGLTYIADLDNVNLNDPQWQNTKVQKILRRLWRNEYRRGITALSGAANNAAYIWDKASGVNPDMDVQTELVAATTASGIRPNRVLYGDTAFLYRNQSYGAQNNPAGYLGYSPNVGQSLAAALQVDKVLVSRERYQTGAADASKTEIVGPYVYSFFAMDGVDVEDPSNIKRFVSQFSGEQGGGLVRVYVQQLSSKLVAITVEHYSKIVITYSGGIRKLSITGPQ